MNKYKNYFYGVFIPRSLGILIVAIIMVLMDGNRDWFWGFKFYIVCYALTSILMLATKKYHRKK